MVITPTIVTRICSQPCLPIHTMLEFFAFLLICLEGPLNTGCNLMKNTCMLVQIQCFLLSILEIHLHLVLVEAHRTVAMLSSLAYLSVAWLNYLPSIAYSSDPQTRIFDCSTTQFEDGFSIQFRFFNFII